MYTPTIPVVNFAYSEISTALKLHWTVAASDIYADDYDKNEYEIFKIYRIFE